MNDIMNKNQLTIVKDYQFDKSKHSQHRFYN